MNALYSSALDQTIFTKIASNATITGSKRVHKRISQNPSIPTNKKSFSTTVQNSTHLCTEDEGFRISSRKHLLTLTIYRDNTKVSIGVLMRKTTTIVLISILLLQMCTGLLVISEESGETFVTTGRYDEGKECEGRANKEEEQDNHIEQDEFGGSWFDDFDGGSGIIKASNVTLANSEVQISLKEVNKWEY